jgi:hypothetical protein
MPRAVRFALWSRQGRRQRGAQARGLLVRQGLRALPELGREAGQLCLLLGIELGELVFELLLLGRLLQLFRARSRCCRWWYGRRCRDRQPGLGDGLRWYGRLWLRASTGNRQRRERDDDRELSHGQRHTDLSFAWQAPELVGIVRALARFRCGGPSRSCPLVALGRALLRDPKRHARGSSRTGLPSLTSRRRAALRWPARRSAGAPLAC